MQDIGLAPTVKQKENTMDIGEGEILKGKIQEAAQDEALADTYRTFAAPKWEPPQTGAKEKAGGAWIDFDQDGTATIGGKDVPFMAVTKGIESFCNDRFLRLHGENIDAALNMRNQRVTGLADGVVSGESKHAINGSQLHTALAGVTRKRRITNQTGTNLEFAAQAPVSAIIYDAAGVNVTNARGVVLSKNQVKAGTVSAMVATDELYIVE